MSGWWWWWWWWSAEEEKEEEDDEWSGSAEEKNSERKGRNSARKRCRISSIACGWPWHDDITPMSCKRAQRRGRRVGEPCAAVTWSRSVMMSTSCWLSSATPDPASSPKLCPNSSSTDRSTRPPRLDPCTSALPAITSTPLPPCAPPPTYSCGRKSGSGRAIRSVCVNKTPAANSTAMRIGARAMRGATGMGGGGGRRRP
mmetsp:Transcript_53150/g.106527  ORF Transcript_53150/g.106527 Transcript_53150/m.106527 type:complete len:200 (-) Transcript_53150:197-796(-)